MDPSIRFRGRLRRRVIFIESDYSWLDKHAVSSGAIKVSLPLYGAIILACSIIEFDAYPVSVCKMRVSKKADCGYAAI